MSATPVAGHDESHGQEAHHGPSVKTYYAIFFALCVLTVVTVMAARFDFAHLIGNRQIGDLVNNVVALGIAFTKATLVVLFFMHVKYEDKLVGLAVVSGVVWLGFLLFITATDYFSRTSAWQEWVPPAADHAPAEPGTAH
jgi:cytochrome c oxidase subunit 4